MRLSTRISLTSLLLSVAVTSASSAGAATITQWNFNGSSAAITTPSTGVGTIATVGGVTSSSASGTANGGSSDPVTTTPTNYAYQTTGYTAQGTANKTAGIQANVSTLGFASVIVNYDLRHSNTSSRYEQFQYSLNGTSFTDFGNPFDGNAGDTWFNNRTVNLSNVAGVANNASFAFRVVSLFAPNTTSYAASNSASAYGTAGTWRFDEVTVQGTAVPEPSEVVGLLGLGLFGGVAQFVRNRRKVQA